MATMHTPGPWRVDGSFRDGSRRINGPDGLALATALDFNRFDRDAEADANARLIAAAPEMRDKAVSTVESWTLLSEAMNTISDNLAHWSPDQVRTHLGQLQNIIDNRDRKARALLAEING